MCSSIRGPAMAPSLVTWPTRKMLLPLIFAIDQPGGELLGPLAVVQFGGLISATVLSLLVVPAASKLLGKRD